MTFAKREGKYYIEWEHRISSRTACRARQAKHNTQKYVHNTQNLRECWITFQHFDALKFKSTSYKKHTDHRDVERKSEIALHRTRTHIRVSCQINWYGFCLVPFCMAISCLYLSLFEILCFFILIFTLFRLPISCGIFVYYRNTRFKYRSLALEKMLKLAIAGTSNQQPVTQPPLSVS